MFVKLCGLRSVEDARAAIAARADALGFILAESKRQVSPELVASIRDEIPAPPSVVGVTVNSSGLELDRLYDKARLDIVQLSGDEEISILNELHMPVIKTLRFADDTDINAAVREVDRWFSNVNAPELVIIEGKHGDSYGGSGRVGDWKLIHEIAVRYPIVLAGGLNPENVADAIERVGPIGVDTSSGTEVDGAKDAQRMIDFVSNARAPFRD